MNDNIDTPAAAAPATGQALAEQAPEFRSSDELANSLYRESTARNEPRTEPHQPGQPDKPAEIQVPENIAKLRAEDMERRMYPKALDGVDVRWLGNPTVAGEFKEMLRDVGIGQQDYDELMGVRGELAGKLPSDEQRAQWRAQTVDMLNRQYGKDAPAMVEAAKQLVQRDARWKQIADLGLGDHPVWVAKFIDLARRQRAAGRLT